MEGTFTRLGQTEEVPLAAPAAQIAKSAPVLLPNAHAASDTSVRRLFINEEQNNRSAIPLGRVAAFTAQHAGAIGYGASGPALLAAHDRLVTAGSIAMQISNWSGATVASHPVGKGRPALDPELGVVYMPSIAGILFGYRLADGQPHHSMGLGRGADFDRRFIVRHGNALLVVSVQIESNVHDIPPQQMMVERLHLVDPTRPVAFMEEGAPYVEIGLRRKTNLVLPAMHGPTLALAMADDVFLTNERLEELRAITGHFTPVALSMDEAARMYLVVQAGQEAALWLLTPAGQRQFDFRFPEGITSVNWTPVVAYDHTVYLLYGTGILAVSPKGELKWRKTSPGFLAGATVTPDGYLLVCEGRQVAVYDPSGVRYLLYEAPQNLVTAPIPLAPGRLAVASESALFILVRS
jgi:hypothetical protein